MFQCHGLQFECCDTFCSSTASALKSTRSMFISCPRFCIALFPLLRQFACLFSLRAIRVRFRGLVMFSDRRGFLDMCICVFTGCFVWVGVFGCKGLVARFESARLIGMIGELGRIPRTWIGVGCWDYWLEGWWCMSSPEPRQCNTRQRPPGITSQTRRGTYRYTSAHSRQVV